MQFQFPHLEVSGSFGVFSSNAWNKVSVEHKLEYSQVLFSDIKFNTCLHVFKKAVAHMWLNESTEGVKDFKRYKLFKF